MQERERKAQGRDAHPRFWDRWVEDHAVGLLCGIALVVFIWWLGKWVRGIQLMCFLGFNYYCTYKHSRYAAF